MADSTVLVEVTDTDDAMQGSSRARTVFTQHLRILVGQHTSHLKDVQEGIQKRETILPTPAKSCIPRLWYACLAVTVRLPSVTGGFPHLALYCVQTTLLTSESATEFGSRRLPIVEAAPLPKID